MVVVESGWGSILPTVILANMLNGGPAARSGKLSIGDQIMSVNGTSLVGLPLATCQGIIKVGAQVLRGGHQPSSRSSMFELRDPPKPVPHCWGQSRTRCSEVGGPVGVTSLTADPRRGLRPHRWRVATLPGVPGLPGWAPCSAPPG